MKPEDKRRSKEKRRISRKCLFGRDEQVGVSLAERVGNFVRSCKGSLEKGKREKDLRTNRMS